MNVCTLTLASSVKNVALIDPFLQSSGLAAMLNTQQYHDVLVGVTEAVNNAIIHGNALDEQKSVSIQLTVAAKAVVIEIEDEGTGFDPNAVPNPTDAENLYNEGGRGVFLMKHLANEVSFAKTETGMRITLTYRL